MRVREGVGLTVPIEWIAVSPEMVTLVGAGDMTGVELPTESAALIIDAGRMPRLTIVGDATAVDWTDLSRATPRVGLVVQYAALGRLFDWSPLSQDGQSYFLTDAMASIVTSLIEPGCMPSATATLRLAKSIELLCETVDAIKGGGLVPASAERSLKQCDGERLVEARRLIDEHWSEKLTLGQIARTCGLNRTKLTRGFRELYRCSIAEALAEKRLGEARRQLLATDLPVGIIGYRSGYSNNASFTRAFGRRFGISPSDYRATGVAA